MSHPLGIKPNANELFESPTLVRQEGLGSLSVLGDPMILEILGYASHTDHSTLSITSRVLYAFSTHEELWRTLTLSSYGFDWRYLWNWRSSFLARQAGLSQDRLTALQTLPPPKVPTHAKGLYSDTLYHAHLCATSPINPRWLAYDNLPREPADLPVERFIESYEAPNTPVLLKGAAGGGRFPGWEEGAWSATGLLSRVPPTTQFHAAGFDVPLASYLEYAGRAKDDHTLYLFDKRFADKVKGLGDYTPPPALALSRDLFAALGEAHRPDWRWMILGPPRSGSVFHQDPNATSAWNICLAGRKKWILAPPDMTPPGVFTSADGAEVCGPLTCMEWMLQFYPHFARQRERREGEVVREGGGSGATVGGPQKRKWGEASGSSGGRQRVYEGIQEAGDCVFVPRGWWHCVMNIGEGVTVAVTHNFCSPVSLPHVLRFLKDKSYAVSGVRPGEEGLLYHRLVGAIKGKGGGEMGDGGEGEKGEGKGEEKTGAGGVKWGEVIKGGSNGGFTFSF